MTKKLKKMAAFLSLALLVFFLTGTSSEPSAINSDEALNLLKEGNERFLNFKRIFPDQDKIRITETAKGQHPFASILACSDSRVPPELFFDRGIGDLFIIRVAGNVADIDEIGTIEYGVEHLKTQLLVVMGHTKCGAVTAVLKGDKVGGFIPQLVDNIIPAADKVKKDGGSVDDNMIFAAVKENVWDSISDTISKSLIVRELIEKKELQVVGAVYHVEDGTIEWLGHHPDEEGLLKTVSQSSNVNNGTDYMRLIFMLLNITFLIIILIIFYFIFVGKNSMIKNIKIKGRMLLSALVLPLLTIFSIVINLLVIREFKTLNLLLITGLPLIICLLFSLIYFRSLLTLFSEYIKFIKNKE